MKVFKFFFILSGRHAQARPGHISFSNGHSAGTARGVYFDNRLMLVQAAYNLGNRILKPQKKIS